MNNCETLTSSILRSNTLLSCNSDPLTGVFIICREGKGRLANGRGKASKVLLPYVGGGQKGFPLVKKETEKSLMGYISFFSGGSGGLHSVERTT